MHHATGTFDVTLTPDSAAGAAVSGMTIAKTLHGGIEGTSSGRMLSVGSPSSGGAGYVAMERVTGTLDGKAGSFALQHSGTIDRNGQSLSVTVVPGSGTDALAALTGAMTIRIEAGKHLYTFDYAIPG